MKDFADGNYSQRDSTHLVIQRAINSPGANLDNGASGAPRKAHFHMLFLDGVYLATVNGSPARFRWVKAPTSDELTGLAHRISQRTVVFLERKGLLARDAENSYLDL